MKFYKLTSLVLFASLIFLTTGCRKEGGITLNFHAVYGEEPLVMLTNYPYTDGDVINFSVSDFFITDVYVTDSEGSTVELLDVEFVDFDAQNVTDELAMIPVSFTVGSIDPADYESITFSIGLDVDDIPWLFHTGKDDVFRTFTYSLDKSVNENIATVDITIDHQELFKVADGYMDIRSKPTNHNPQDLEPLITITENFATAVTVD